MGTVLRLCSGNTFNGRPNEEIGEIRKADVLGRGVCIELASVLFPMDMAAQGRGATVTRALVPDQCLELPVDLPNCSGIQDLLTVCGG